jgi:DNA gyrase subunit A
MDELREILSDEEKLRAVVAAELTEMAKLHGTPRRTQLVDASGIVISRKPVEISELSDDPCGVYLTPSGKVYRSELSDASYLSTTLRSDVGMVLNSGVAIQVHVSDLPVDETNAMTADELAGHQGVIGVVPWRGDQIIAMGSAQGVVKQVQLPLPDKHEVGLITLKEGDELVGVGIARPESSLLFVSSDGNLLHFKPEAVRPQGLPAGGMAGMKLIDSNAVFFGVADADHLVVSCANSSQALSGTDAGSYKASPLSSFPMKGRGTQGVRIQRFLKGEDQIYFSGLAKPGASVFDADEKEICKLEIEQKRDASGQPLARVAAGLN